MKKQKVSFVIADRNSEFGRYGQRITLDLTPDDVHDPTEMPTYLAGYTPFAFRADEASPVILTDHDKDKYRTFDSENAFEPVDVKTSIEGKVQEIDPRSTLATYTVVERAIGSFIPDQVMQNATNAYRPRQAAMKRCQWAIMLDREIDVWTLLTTTGSWNSDNHTTLGATTKWNGGSASDPIKDLHTRIEASAQEVTDVWMSQRTANTFLRHPSVRDHMRQMIGDNAPNATLAQVNSTGRQRRRDFQIPGFPDFRVSAAKKLNTSGTLEYVIGNDVVLLSRPDGVPTDGEEIATSYTMRRRGGAGVGFETREFRIEERGSKGGTMIVVNMADIALMTGSNVGGLIKAAWA